MRILAVHAFTSGVSLLSKNWMNLTHYIAADQIHAILCQDCLGRENSSVIFKRTHLPAKRRLILEFSFHDFGQLPSGSQRLRYSNNKILKPNVGLLVIWGVYEIVSRF